MPEFYPMLFKPTYKDYIWGGRNLEKFGRDLHGMKKVAESWEIAAHEDGMTRVANGNFAGSTLQSLVDDFGVCLVGTKNRWALDRGKFPFLVKLIDANQALSVQVHPDDAYAKAHENNELGKSEMWVVLDAEPGAEIIFGLTEQMTPKFLQKAIENSNLEKYLNRVSIKPGDHVCVPAGSLHAILQGAVLVEIQQNSNTTYRVYDWNRVGKDGQPRPLHIKKALDVINYDQIEQKLASPRIIASKPTWKSEMLCQNSYFTVERHIIKKSGEFSGDCNGKTLEIWGVISGEVVLNGVYLKCIEFVLLPAGMGSFTVNAQVDSVLLRAYAT